MCIRTGEEGFGSMAIDPKIIRECTEQAAQYYAMAIGSSGTSTPRSSSPSCFDSSLSTPPSSPSSGKSLRSQLAKKKFELKRKYARESDAADTVIDSGLGDSARTSPTMVNHYVKYQNKPCFKPDYQLSRPSVHKWETRSPSPKSPSREATPLTKDMTIKSDEYDSSDDYTSSALPIKLSYVTSASKKRKRCFEVTAEELSAARALLELNMGDVSCTRRRASF